MSARLAVTAALLAVVGSSTAPAEARTVPDLPSPPPDGPDYCVDPALYRDPGPLAQCAPPVRPRQGDKLQNPGWCAIPAVYRGGPPGLRCPDGATVNLPELLPRR